MVKIKVLLLFLITISFNFIQSAYQSQFPDFLRDFLNNQRSSSEVCFLLCYKPSNLVKIAQLSQVPVAFGRIENYNFTRRNEVEVIFFVVDFQCPATKAVLESKIDSKYYALPFRWIMLTNDATSLPNINAFPDSNIFLVASEGNGFKVTQFYRIEANQPIIFESYATWSSVTGLIVSQPEEVLSKRRQDLRGKDLTTSIVITNNNTLNHLEDMKDKHIDSITKVNFQITKTLISTVNGTMNWKPVNTWGYRNPKTGIWNGMTGDLVYNRAEIGGTGMFMVAVRVPFVDYLSMTVPTLSAFIFREPPLSYVSNIYSLPFTRRVWIGAGCLVVLSVIVILLTVTLERKRDSMETGKIEIRFRPSDFILLGISAICQMGTLIPPKIISTRISTIFLLIAVLFLYTSYTANIVALLQSTTKSIQTLSDLLNSQLKVGLDDTVYNRHYFPTATEPVRRALYQKKVLSKGIPRYMNTSTGISHLRKGLFAFHIELGVGYKLIEESFFEHEKCNLMTIPFIQVVNTWYAIKKHSPYKEMLKVALFRIREYGLQARENAKIYTKKPVCAANGKSFASVRLIDCYAALVVLAIGYGLAFIIFFFEKILNDGTLCTL